MTIEKLPSGSYRVKKMYRGKYYSVTFPYKPTDKEAMICLSKKMSEQANAEKGNGGTFESYANRYISNRKSVLSPATIRTYSIKLNQCSDALRNKNIFDIEPEDIQREISSFSKNHAPKTTRTLHGFIASVLGAYRPELILNTTLPVRKIEPQYEPSECDIRRILDDAKGTRYSIPFQLGVLGCRRGEICALELDDLNGNELRIHRSKVYENGKWIVKDSPKTESSNRTLYLPDSLAEEIKEAGTIYEGHPNALNKAVHRAQERLGIEQFKFHALRSYFASYAHSLGIPDSDIMSMGGWKTDSVMKSVYRKSLEASRKESMTKLSTQILRG